MYDYETKEEHNDLLLVALYPSKYDNVKLPLIIACKKSKIVRYLLLFIRTQVYIVFYDLIMLI